MGGSVSVVPLKHQALRYRYRPGSHPARPEEQPRAALETTSRRFCEFDGWCTEPLHIENDDVEMRVRTSLPQPLGFRDAQYGGGVDPPVVKVGRDDLRTGRMTVREQRVER